MRFSESTEKTVSTTKARIAVSHDLPSKSRAAARGTNGERSRNDTKCTKKNSKANEGQLSFPWTFFQISFAMLILSARTSR
jgi:hypothetical protein